jgi:hypothetical protein
MREVMRLIHPNAVIAVKINKVTVPDSIAQAVWGFFSAYVIVFFAMLVGIMATGVDQVTAWSTVGSALNNLGPALGNASAHYGDLPALAKWFLVLAMLLAARDLHRTGTVHSGVLAQVISIMPAFSRRPDHHQPSQHRPSLVCLAPWAIIAFSLCTIEP